MSSTLWLVGVASILTVVASGCAGEDARLARLGLEHPVWTSEGLYLVERNGPGALFLTPEPQELSGYDSVVIGDIRLGFKEGGREFTRLERDRALVLVPQRILHALSELGLQRAQGPGPGALRVRIAITEIDYQPVAITGGGTAVLRASGRADITVELRDSVDDRQLLVYSQARPLPFGAYSGRHIGAERIADAVYEYSLNLARNFDEARRGELAGPRPPGDASLED